MVTDILPGASGKAHRYGHGFVIQLPSFLGEFDWLNTKFKMSLLIWKFRSIYISLGQYYKLKPASSTYGNII